MARVQDEVSAALSPGRVPPRTGTVVQPASLPKGMFVIAVVAALYFGRDIFMPLAIAILLTFALAPLVSMLRRIRVPRAAAVVVVVLGAFAAILLFGGVVAVQLGSLAGNLPRYQQNIESKIQGIRDAQIGEGIIDRLSQLLERLGREIQSEPPAATPAAPAGEEVTPIPVEIIEPPPQALQVVQTIIGPLIEPAATGGIIIVVVIFMLLKREDLRDRFIRLVGAGDLHRTTEALQEAGSRVGNYLLMQLIVNVTYAVPIGIGLWLIGVPNALLWGLMALVLRFVPYIGPIIASVFPLALSVAVDPGWSMFLWTGALFITVELISNNFVEPWLYGSRTGLSPLAIIVAAVFWTWLWGAVGLLLPTPLTVCLVVLGRHVPQFEFLDVLFGNQPVLEPHQQLYQRLLAGDPDEATDRAEAFLADHQLAAFYEIVGLPALALGEQDRQRGVMGDDRYNRVTESAMTLVGNLDEYASEEAEEDEAAEAEEAGAEKTPTVVEGEKKDLVPHIALPDGTDIRILCAGGRGDLDNVAAAMVAQVLTAQAATVTLVENKALDPRRLRTLDLTSTDAALITFLSAQALANARYMVRRLKRVRPSLKVGVLLWGRMATTLDEVKLAAEIGCDFVAHTLVAAASQALASDEENRTLPAVPRGAKRDSTAAVMEPATAA